MAKYKNLKNSRDVSNKTDTKHRTTSNVERNKSKKKKQKKKCVYMLSTDKQRGYYPLCVHFFSWYTHALQSTLPSLGCHFNGW